MIISIMLACTSSAKILDKQIVAEANKILMTRNENVRVKRFVTNFGKKTKRDARLTRYFKAINLMLDTADYEKRKYKAIDVLYGKANCAGYAVMFSMLLDSIDIDNKIVCNDKHMWNEVKLNTKYRKIDLTALEHLNFRFNVERGGS